MDTGHTFFFLVPSVHFLYRSKSPKTLVARLRYTIFSPKSKIWVQGLVTPKISQKPCSQTWVHDIWAQFPGTAKWRRFCRLKMPENKLYCWFPLNLCISFHSIYMFFMIILHPRHLIFRLFWPESSTGPDNTRDQFGKYSPWRREDRSRKILGE